MDKPSPIFESSADAALEKVRATYSQRGEEYADSWNSENIVTTFSAATLLAFGLRLTVEQMRLLQCAALIDMKDSRLGGPWKADSLVDSIAYRACYLTLREQYESAKHFEHMPRIRENGCATLTPHEAQAQ